MNEYQKMKERHKKELSEFPTFRAYSKREAELQKQLRGLKAISYLGMGVFSWGRNVEKAALLVRRQRNEIHLRMFDDKDGTGFMYDVFHEELMNTGFSKENKDMFGALVALDLTEEMFMMNERLLRSFNQAAADILKVPYGGYDPRVREPEKYKALLESLEMER